MDSYDLVVPEEFNTRKIPRANYIQDIAKVVAETNGDTGLVITGLDNTLQRYNFMFQNFQQQRNALCSSLPELLMTQAALKQLQSMGDLPEGSFFHYELSAGVYAKAKIMDRSKVALFLGSRTMVEYTIDEALKVLEDNTKECKDQINDLERNLEFLKEQITTSEVSISRVFNWDVMEHRTVK
ncbi:Prefoldin subunit 3 [Spironucleus salmonicida]|uniref:Prefoldin subunit 3 n=1 Tax=Spironucleus salmonicida TaxID=348837 RepID=V6LSJ4_9EUKA|nr:Prefoldin subunit 3 [Spironucleus salmonicida]|eukprot:EST47642.1 Prefoldin subunit 3 [Spironucleus salmonicida]